MISDYLYRTLPSTDELPCYAKLGVLYYIIYNPEFWQRDRQQPFEVHKLSGERTYQLQVGEPYWMPEIGLGIGRYRGVFNGIDRELFAWFDRTGTRYLMPEESLQLEKQRTDRLAAQLRALGIDPSL